MVLVVVAKEVLVFGEVLVVVESIVLGLVVAEISDRIDVVDVSVLEDAVFPVAVGVISGSQDID